MEILLGGNLIVTLSVLDTSIWVYVDATNIGVKKGQIGGFADAGPGTRFGGCLLLWIVIFPLYLVKRGAYIRISSELKEVALNVKKCPDCAETIKQ